MNNQPTMPQHANPSWGGAHPLDPRLAAPQHTPPGLIDLTAERNVLQLGFEDNEYILPHNMANNSARSYTTCLCHFIVHLDIADPLELEYNPNFYNCSLSVLPNLHKSVCLLTGLTTLEMQFMQSEQ
ncbi:hypothetical protein TELCIR_08005 [Teladorsagia circumcincta]|uniref:Uncharacterized protein n=1 Tax=Teladorsagia circumcincta TaxID=45464 RepID=A0A2G9UIS6_TELCI|nr:hypothetical protein TELCIR_08005 [Teladorsagia circumcincta]